MNDIFKYLTKLVPGNFFLSAGLVFGLFFLFITPPFQVPDEPNHLLKAWQISDGVLKSVKQDQRLGGYLPESLLGFIIPYSRITWDKKHTLSFVPAEEVKNVTVGSNKIFCDFGNTALYSPVCYAPQAIGILVARLFTSNVNKIFYAARLSGFLTWLALVFFAIRLTPVFKWLFAYLALLPTSLFVNMSLSADLMTNGLCFLYFACILRLCFREAAITHRELFLLAAIVVLLASVKIVYVPLLLLLFILPKDKFKTSTIYYTWLPALLITGVVVVYFWSRQIAGLYIPYDDYNKLYRDTSGISATANLYEQLVFLKEDYWRIFSVIYQSMVDCSVSHITGFVAVFDWMNTTLPKAMIYALYAFIFVIAASENGSTQRLGWKKRIVLLSLFLLILSLLFLSQYLTWVYVGGPSVSHIQGRYLIPFYPLIFMIFYGTLGVKKTIAPLVAIIAMISLFCSCLVLYDRYVEAIL